MSVAKRSDTTLSHQPSNWIRLQITATLLSDAHMGSGVGGQGLHALLARDRWGNPVIWATQETGETAEPAMQNRIRRLPHAHAADSV
ncbi:MAG TPA: hypothetical protein PKE31_21080 [Pseudomonadota bacterium]|nr:hypothetical protein [Pseudomonadota bacterium]